MRRYEPKPWDIRRCDMIHADEGEYVLYCDAQAEIERLTAQLKQARMVQDQLMQGRYEQSLRAEKAEAEKAEAEVAAATPNMGSAT